MSTLMELPLSTTVLLTDRQGEFLAESVAGHADEHLGGDGLGSDIRVEQAVVSGFEADGNQFGGFVIGEDGNGVLGRQGRYQVTEGDLGAVRDLDGGLSAGHFGAADLDDIILGGGEGRDERGRGDGSRDNQDDVLLGGIDHADDVGGQGAVETVGEREGGQFALPVGGLFRLAGNQDRNGCKGAGQD